MNACQFGAVLIIGIFTSHAYAGEQQQQDQSSIGTFASTQESAALQAIRWRVAVSCNQNSECATRSALGANNPRFVPSSAAPGASPSTPERRRALGLVKDQENLR